MKINFTLTLSDDRTICIFLDHVSAINEAHDADKKLGIGSYIWIDSSDTPFKVSESFENVCQKIGSYMSEDYWHGNTDKPS